MDGRSELKLLLAVRPYYGGGKGTQDRCGRRVEVNDLRAACRCPGFDDYSTIKHASCLASAIHYAPQQFEMSQGVFSAVQLGRFGIMSSNVHVAVSIVVALIGQGRSPVF
jgi:hypothetical protein